MHRLSLVYNRNWHSCRAQHILYNTIKYRFFSTGILRRYTSNAWYEQKFCRKTIYVPVSSSGRLALASRKHKHILHRLKSMKFTTRVIHSPSQTDSQSRLDVFWRCRQMKDVPWFGQEREGVDRPLKNNDPCHAAKHHGGWREKIDCLQTLGETYMFL
jgi:hypothetical protein